MAPSGKKVAIVQSNYIPWKGYFDLIASVDEFILYDDMQYTRRDWRNRNMIKTPTGAQWLTIPVDVKGKYLQKIRETRVSDPEWAQLHWATLKQNYARSPYFREYGGEIQALYRRASEESMLSRINYIFIEAVCRFLGIETRVSWSMDYPAVEGKTERLVSLCQAAGATQYLSGPAARGYIDEILFENAGIKLSYVSYDGYPEYKQLWGPFNHYVTVLDLILNAGPDARRYMKSLE